ncbi:MAG: MFS transporter [Deltaproteobacteria bacterium]
MVAGASTRRERVGWYFYDWANSAFSTSVVTVFLGPYLTTVARAAADGNGFVRPFGITVGAGSFFPYVVSLSVLFQVILLPILGALADYTHRRKQMLLAFACTGAFATMGFYFLRGTNYLLGGGLFLVANLCFGASIVFYNAFLPDLAAPERRDSVSAMGWAVGYLGGGILLALNLILFSRAGALGLSAGDAARISLVSAGAWWALFTLVPMATLKERSRAARPPRGEHYLAAGFRQLGRTFRKARRYRQTWLFLLAYLLYNDGIQTVIALAAQFGQEELHLPMATLTTAILMVQFVAFFGAHLFNGLAKAVGARCAVMASLVVWTGAVVHAYAFLRTENQFYALCAVIALVLGGSQALSRSLFSLLIPKGEEAEYFALYEVGERGTSWIGPLLFGLALQFTGSYRVAILSLVAFFAAGFVLLGFVDVATGAREAGNDPSIA